MAEPEAYSPGTGVPSLLTTLPAVVTRSPDGGYPGHRQPQLYPMERRLLQATEVGVRMVLRIPLEPLGPRSSTSVMVSVVASGGLRVVSRHAGGQSFRVDAEPGCQLLECSGGGHRIWGVRPPRRDIGQAVTLAMAVVPEHEEGQVGVRTVVVTRSEHRSRDRAGERVIAEALAAPVDHDGMGQPVLMALAVTGIAGVGRWDPEARKARRSAGRHHLHGSADGRSEPESITLQARWRDAAGVSGRGPRVPLSKTGIAVIAAAGEQNRAGFAPWDAVAVDDGGTNDVTLLAVQLRDPGLVLDPNVTLVQGDEQAGGEGLTEGHHPAGPPACQAEVRHLV